MWFGYIREVKISLRQRVRGRNFCSDIFISCVIPGLLFVIVVVDDEMEAMSRSFVYENVMKTTAIFHCRSRTRCRSEILTSLLPANGAAIVLASPLKSIVIP